MARPKFLTERVIFRIEPQLLSRAEALAKKQRRNLSAVLRDALETGLPAVGQAEKSKNGGNRSDAKIKTE